MNTPMNTQLHPSDRGPGYLSYLVRLRRIQSGEGYVWRASLEEPLTQQVRRFADLPTLFAFLHAQIALDLHGDCQDILSGVFAILEDQDAPDVHRDHRQQERSLWPL